MKPSHDTSLCSSPESLSAGIRLVLFDVGGVLVQLSGVATLLGWLDHTMTPEELWQLWLRSPSVRAFETGQLEPLDFAAGIIRELDIEVAPEHFLESFIEWPVGLYPGTLEMIDSIPRRYQRAMLSNSNALHWSRLMDDMQLGAAFDHHFSSHLMGKIKPDAEAFHHVLDALDCKAPEVLFLDDNSLNVDAARSLGMHAVRVQGVTEAGHALRSAGIIAAHKRE